MLGYTYAKHVNVVGHPFRVKVTWVDSFQGKDGGQEQKLFAIITPKNMAQSRICLAKCCLAAMSA